MTHVHFIGIGGTGLSAIARVLLEMGFTVSGSDRVLSPFAEGLKRDGATIHAGHDAANVSGADWVVRSSAIADDNPEVTEARKRGIPVYKRADFLGRLMEDKIGIAVAGTHGKTTTTSMIAWMLFALGRDPSFIIGSTLANLKTNARAGRGKPFVIEADEYDRMFLGLKPFLAIVTNIEHDHPDCYPTFEDMYAAFESFAKLLPTDGTLIACLDDPAANTLLNGARKAGRNVVGYGLQGEQTLNAPQFTLARGLKPNERGGFDFEAVSNLFPETESIPVSLQVPGKYNVQNSLAALSVAALLGLPPKKAAEALGEFRGAGRRFEVLGEANGVTVINDYGHHPTEIRATLAGARARYPEHRIWAVWQPHTYSRTQTLFDQFVKAFGDADEVLVTEVYASREAKQDFTSAMVVSSMRHPSAHFTATLDDTTKYLLEHLRPGDVLIVFSAGDADQVSADVLAGLTK
ncbi:MAG: UDP-N-acetylmuramate--L-alanine ligase [Anaerolineaceae bacterium]|nr:MAG: UDP-N-acetylmuramate--L-alanine ligase [Anaerolineaceae bacterium]